MRIIAGRLKGRVLRGPTGPGVRPTSDRLRETLFNVLRDRVDGARVLDAFAGTGAVGLEALSRGAAHATFVERDRRAAALIEENAATCGCSGDVTVVRDDFLRMSGQATALGPFDLVWLDPPYDTPDLAAALSVARSVIAPDGLVVLEHSRRRESPLDVGGLVRQRVLQAGDSALAFYALMPAG